MDQLPSFLRINSDTQKQLTEASATYQSFSLADLILPSESIIEGFRNVDLVAVGCDDMCCLSGLEESIWK